MPYTVHTAGLYGCIVRSYCMVSGDGCMPGLWRQSSRVTVTKAGMVKPCSQDGVVVAVRTVSRGGAQRLPPTLSRGLWREESLWGEHVYPALLTWFISTSKQPEHELFTLHCDTEEKREEGWRGRWIWEKMSNVMHRSGREKGRMI